MSIKLIEQDVYVKTGEKKVVGMKLKTSKTAQRFIIFSIYDDGDGANYTLSIGGTMESQSITVTKEELTGIGKYIETVK